MLYYSAVDSSVFSFEAPQPRKLHTLVLEKLEGVNFLVKLDRDFTKFISEPKDVCPICWSFYRLKVIDPCQR